MIRRRIVLRSTRGGVGGHQQSVIQYHSHIPTLELLTAVNALSSNYEYKLNHNVFSTFSQAWNAFFSPFGLFHKSKWQIFLSFHILLPVKSLPFHTPEVWKAYSFLAEPPRIGHYWEYLSPPSPHGKKHYRLCHGFQSLSTRFFRFTTIRWVPALGGLCGRPVE